MDVAEHLESTASGRPMLSCDNSSVAVKTASRAQCRGQERLFGARTNNSANMRDLRFDT